MTFEEVLDQALAMLQRRGRVMYQTLKLQFQLDEEHLEALTDAILYTHPQVHNDAGCGLVWTPAAPIVAAEAAGRFDAVVAAVTALLRCEGRVTYRRLTLACGLDAALLAAVCRELTFTQVAHDGHGEGLVWTGDPSVARPHALPSVRQPASPDAAGLPVAESLAWSTQVPAPVVGLDPQDDGRVPAPARPPPEAERRQLTVLFCDLVGSTQLSGQLDPEDLRTVVRAYQEAAAEVIQHYEGHIAQYLGDGLLVYFGYPTAHEDDARRAVHTGLGTVEAIATLNTLLAAQYGVQLAVRLGIHTGPVVVGVMGGGGRHEHLALGETPNIAARLQALAPANTAVISAVTARLVQGTFALEDLGTYTLNGVAEPMAVSRVRGVLATSSHDEEFLTAVVPVLVGREEESGLLRRRWEQSQAGLGQVVFVSGEAGIGKSALVEGLRAQVRAEGLPRVAFRCSPYHTTSALYPVITHLERLLQLAPDDPPTARLAKLEAGLRPSGLPPAEVVPLLAGLLLVPLPAERYAAVTLTPQQQKQQTLDALVAWLAAEAERQPVLVAWEDLHWADPTTLEVLGLVIEQAPTVPMLHVLTYRPEFSPPWPQRSHITPIVLTRLERPQVAALITLRAGGKHLPAEVVQYIVAKTDGVPLYVEELTKMLLASPLLREEADRYVLTGPLHTVAIPDTLQDALMARLDQLNRAKEVVQLGAVLGREFPYELLQAIAPQDEDTLQAGLVQLVGAELLYQRGRPPRARYLFKHALIQDAAYASLLKSTRQQVHQQIAQVFEARFPALVETQPELVAQHYTAAGCIAQAVGYWQQAGQQARQRSANAEAVQHLSQGLELLAMLPETPVRVQQELDLRLALGAALMATKGHGAPEVAQTYARARALCAQVGETPQRFPALRGLCRFYYAQGALQTARELGEELFSLAQRTAVPLHLLEAQDALGTTLFQLGEYAGARTYLEQAPARTDLTAQRALVLHSGDVPEVRCLVYAANALWCLGYPDQALRRCQEALAQGGEHPQSLAAAQHMAILMYHRRREAPGVQAQAAALLNLATAQRFPLYMGFGTFWRGWTLVMQGESEVGLAQMRQGMAAVLATGQELSRPLYLALLAEAVGHTGQAEEGLLLLAEALAAFEAIGRGDMLADAYRLQGELLLCQATPNASQAEACFQQALTIACRQEAKSLELRAAMSLSRLWQQQDQQAKARALLAPIYSWFTEGFDTADLQEAQALLEALA